uniref:Uncharacterized protein n=1 Tax=Bos mutus grunniens TaxID=30521 RepID=A0A8B9YBA9_BOSMU
MPMDKIVTVLSMVQLDCIQEVQVSCTWSLSTLATLAPFLGEMSNLQRLHLSHVHVSAFKKQEHDHVVQITSQFRRLGHLRDLHLESPSFLEGCLDQMLRCLRSPLDSLSLTKCRLTESDLTHVSQSPDISQLKSLDLSGVPMTDFRPELLQVLLEKVAATLQEVDLDACGITDSQLEAFLPALSRCSQLRAVSLCGNLLSTAVMEKLLRHTAVLPCLRQGVIRPSGDLQTSGCSPGSETCPASGSAVGDSQRLGTSQDHLDKPQPLSSLWGGCMPSHGAHCIQLSCPCLGGGLYQKLSSVHLATEI